MSIEERFMRSVRSAFPICYKNERRFLADFQCSVHEYCIQKADVTMELLIQKFGSPQKIVVEYFDNMDSSVYLALMKKAYYIKILTISIIVALILVIGIIVFWFQRGYTVFHDNIITYIEESVSADE